MYVYSIRLANLPVCRVLSSPLKNKNYKTKLDKIEAVSARGLRFN